MHISQITSLIGWGTPYDRSMKTQVVHVAMAYGELLPMIEAAKHHEPGYSCPSYEWLIPNDPPWHYKFPWEFEACYFGFIKEYDGLRALVEYCANRTKWYSTMGDVDYPDNGLLFHITVYEWVDREGRLKEETKYEFRMGDWAE